MKIRPTSRPGQNGTRRLAARFDERLVRVRYRYAEQWRKRYATVEFDA